MKAILIKDILVSNPDGHEVQILGWVRTKRDSKNLCFIQVNDGSCFASIQLTFDRDSNNPNKNNIEEQLKKVTTGASVKAVDGKIVYIIKMYEQDGTATNYTCAFRKGAIYKYDAVQKQYIEIKN